MDDSFAAVIRDFLNSPYFGKLAKSTQDGWRRELLLAQHTMGDLRVELVTRAVVQKYFEALSDLPGKQKLAVTALTRLQNWGIARERLPRQFMLEIETTESDGGHEPWTDEQIEMALEHGSKHIKKMVSLAYWLGQRGSDLIRMKWTDIKERGNRVVIPVIQQKTGLALDRPLEHAHAAELKSWPRESFFILLDEWGKPFKNRERFTWSWTKERDNNPKLEGHRHLVMHGLRASCVIRLRKQGYTELEISSIVGMSVPMVTHYCRLTDKNDLATKAMDRVDNVRMLVPKSQESKA